jgi:integrase
MNTASMIAAQIQTHVEVLSEYSAQWELAAEGIYRYRPNGTYYYRPVLPSGKRTYRSLKTKNLKLAKEKYYSLQANNGNVAEARLVVEDILARYEQDGYLDDDLASRPQGTEEEEKRHVALLRKFWSQIRVPDVSDPVCDNYFEWRKGKLKQGTGERTTDRELNTLNNAFKYAKRRGLIRVNPLADRPKYQKSGSVRHCREFGPNDADELHAAASLLFQHPNSVVLGFQLLSEAYTGLRTKEILAWGIDHFGTRTPDGKYVNVWRCKNQHHINPYVNVHEGLLALLEAHKKWKAENYPDSPHFFPSHCGGVVDKGALAHALRRITPKLKKKLTSHGMRAFYVLVRRSQGATDEQIAWELGHQSNGACIRSTYGGVPENWKNGGGPNLKWLPSTIKPAWETIPPKHNGMKKP